MTAHASGEKGCGQISSGGPASCALLLQSIAHGTQAGMHRISRLRHIQGQSAAALTELGACPVFDLGINAKGKSTLPDTGV